MEKIYTIPVNEAFEASEADHACGCPFCTLYRKLENDQLELILGASMMEPDVRIKTNEKGFCATHFQMLLSGKNRLGLGLMLESHTEQLKKELADKGLAALVGRVGIAAPRRVARLETSTINTSGLGWFFRIPLQPDSSYMERYQGTGSLCGRSSKNKRESASSRRTVFSIAC